MFDVSMLDCLISLIIHVLYRVAGTLGNKLIDVIILVNLSSEQKISQTSVNDLLFLNINPK